MSREGTTVVYTYGGPSILDECAKNNLKVIWSPYPPALDKIRHGHIKHLLTSEEAKQIKDYVNTAKTHPAILAWLLSDEPEVIPSVPESLKAIYDAIDEVDPYHPCLIWARMRQFTGEPFIIYLERFFACKTVKEPPPPGPRLDGQCGWLEIDIMLTNLKQ